MAKLNGTAILLKIGGNILEAQTTSDFESSTDMLECTTKLSGRFKEFIAGEMGSTLSFEGKYNSDPTGTNIGLADLMSTYLAGTSVTFILGAVAQGSEIIEGTALLSDISWSAPQNEISTFSGTLQVTGVWDFDVVS
jgi:predicted secreted protein